MNIAPPQDAADLWVTIQSRPHTHSGHGVSHYKEWGQACTKRAQLNQQLKESGLAVANPVDKKGLSYFDVGSYYHQLHEIYARGMMPTEIWDASEAALDQNFTEGLRLFHGWQRAFGTVEDKYGAEVVATEVPYLDETLFPASLTGRVDCVINVQEPLAAKSATRTHVSPGLSLEPGIYLLDYKTASSYSANDTLKYSRDLQARCYLTLYNHDAKLTGKAHAKGMIFDQIVKHQKLSRFVTYDKAGKIKQTESFHAYMQPVQEDDYMALEALIRLGLAREETPLANPAACMGMWEICPHLLSGACRGY